jgi:hypothetical protein
VAWSAEAVAETAPVRGAVCAVCLGHPTEGHALQLGWRSRSSRMAPMTRGGRCTAASRVAKWSGDDAVRQPEPDDRRAAAEGADLRRRWRVACLAVIGCALAGGAEDCDRPRQNRLPSSGGFLAVLRLIIRLARPGHNPQADDARGATGRRRRLGAIAIEGTEGIASVVR